MQSKVCVVFEQCWVGDGMGRGFLQKCCAIGYMWLFALSRWFVLLIVLMHACRCVCSS